MSNERAIKLPGGGTAYAFESVPHREATILRKHHLKIGRFMGPVRDIDGQPSRDYRPDLTPEQWDAKDDLIATSETLYIRTLVRRWEGVTSPDGETLNFPEDVERMAESELLFLAGNLMDGGRADPNGEPPSGSSSTRESGPTTPERTKT